MMRVHAHERRKTTRGDGRTGTVCVKRKVTDDESVVGHHKNDKNKHSYHSGVVLCRVDEKISDVVHACLCRSSPQSNSKTSSTKNQGS
mmetsp:Transcript_10045/g.9714  ORF Transcript_10045/g.9714 Transcript_10045/m.9714 type:complete len:88 (+) Transcript_10045:867-1130(+)